MRKTGQTILLKGNFMLNQMWSALTWVANNSNSLLHEKLPDVSAII